MSTAKRKQYVSMHWPQIAYACLHSQEMMIPHALIHKKWWSLMPEFTRNDDPYALTHKKWWSLCLNSQEMMIPHAIIHNKWWSLLRSLHVHALLCFECVREFVLVFQHCGFWICDCNTSTFLVFFEYICDCDTSTVLFWLSRAGWLEKSPVHTS